jgi:nitroimidazol reductase NimA-like FMN-containing flavoprotein (pyridoxamine 5'-phosphate oxidase superfamily)
MSIEQPTTQLTRSTHKASLDRVVLDTLLDDVRIGHFGLIDNGHPVVIATAIVRDGDRVLIHGSTGSRWMRALAAGAPTSLAVTSLDGLVVARSAFESSMHYRSAVLFGRCQVVEDASIALDVITDGLLPGRVEEVRRPTTKELAATLVLELPIERWSLKLSTAWPEDPADDVAGPAWAGIVPIQVSYGNPVDTHDLEPGRAVPDSVRRLINRSGQAGAP